MVDAEKRTLIDALFVYDRKRTAVMTAVIHSLTARGCISMINQSITPHPAWVGGRGRGRPVRRVRRAVSPCAVTLYRV